MKTSIQIPVGAWLLAAAVAGADGAASAQQAPADLRVHDWSGRRIDAMSEIRWNDQQAGVQVEPAAEGPGRARPGGAYRAYRFYKTSGRADRTERVVAEAAGEPYLRSGNVLFDGLFALGLADEQLDRVSQIRDDSFDEGRPVDCVCFEAGEKWHYVWTRDISYAVDLGLAAIDPQRSLNSLLFKTSDIRANLLIDGVKPASVVAQDTGSGGSWPVSTDRVVWILAASDVLQHLSAAARPAAASQLYAVARDTVEQDRRFVFDALSGLYRGETSFLDWREQNYPGWTRSDVSSIAAGYAFSTNVLHVIALRRTAQLAKELGDPLAMRYGQWAEELQRAINTRFWQDSPGLYTSYLSAEPNSVPSNSYDLLGCQFDPRALRRMHFFFLCQSFLPQVSLLPHSSWQRGTTDGFTFLCNRHPGCTDDGGGGCGRLNIATHPFATECDTG